MNLAFALHGAGSGNFRTDVSSSRYLAAYIYSNRTMSKDQCRPCQRCSPYRSSPLVRVEKLQRIGDLCKDELPISLVAGKCVAGKSCGMAATAK
jgi:hypothetical protein